MKYGSRWFSYVYNLQGDVVGLVDSSNTLVVEYHYDAWGKPIGVSGSAAASLGALNPFRYRGYVYDEETGLYYLKTRYYNPTWGRFINADTNTANCRAFVDCFLRICCGNYTLALDNWRTEYDIYDYSAHFVIDNLTNGNVKYYNR